MLHSNGLMSNGGIGSEADPSDIDVTGVDDQVTAMDALTAAIDDCPGLVSDALVEAEQAEEATDPVPEAAVPVNDPNKKRLKRGGSQRRRRPRQRTSGIGWGWPTMRAGCLATSSICNGFSWICVIRQRRFVMAQCRQKQANKNSKTERRRLRSARAGSRGLR